jgi:hypothetical protein
MVRIPDKDRCIAIVSSKLAVNVGKRCVNRAIRAMERRDQIKHYESGIRPNSFCCPTHAWTWPWGGIQR